MDQSNEDYDVVVIGGGPGGSAAAGLLAQRGRRVLVLEKEKFPRYHIGESLITGSFPALAELDLLERLENLGFTKKYGGTLLWGKHETPVPAWAALGGKGGRTSRTWGFRFREASNYEHAYQVRRADFDALLLGRARELGAHVIEEATVKEPILDGERVVGVSYLGKGETQARIATCRMLIDASGQTHLLGRHFDLVEWHEDLRNIAVWAYFQNCRRFDGERFGDILTEARPTGWFWFIPLSDGTVSIGYVTPIAEYQRSGKRLEDLFAAELASADEITYLTEHALRASAFRTIRDWSYTCRQFHGPGWALVGDAAAFIDPLLSTGVTLAVRGAHGLAETVEAVLTDPSAEERLLGRYEQNYRDFLESLLDFVRFFYDRNRPKEDYWAKAQASIDPAMVRAPKVDFATMLSGLTGLKDVFERPRSVFEGVQVDHVAFYVSDLASATQWLVDSFGFSVYAAGHGAEVHSVGLGRDQIRFRLTEARVGDHPAAAYVDRHGDGVADIALRVGDARAAFDEAIRRGARCVAEPTRHGDITTATIMGFGDVTHTFIERPDDADDRQLPGLEPVPVPAEPVGAELNEVDHFAVCVEAGQMDATVEFYEKVLDFQLIFAERIAVGSQAIVTKVVQSRSGAVTLTLIEPDVSQAPGQIDEFLKSHGGTGVQHIAFTTPTITSGVESIAARGVEFLTTPSTYYTLLQQRVELTRYPIEDLERLNILVDEDHDGQLFQIFARSVHPRGTLFFELIERFGARSFGSSNIKALYEAVRLQQDSERSQ